jgi:hypothetical protein
MEKNGEIKQKGHLYQMGHNPFRSFYAGIPIGASIDWSGRKTSHVYNIFLVHLIPLWMLS